MKRKTIKSILAVFILGFYVSTTFAQAPAKMSYQAVVRDGSGVLLSNQQVGMKISVLQGSANGVAVYVETQTPTSNANGLLSIAFGTGTVVSGTFAGIDWASGPYFIKTETDPTGGANYTMTSTNQLMSVPYAQHAKNGNSNGTQVGEMKYWDGSAWVSMLSGNNGDILSFVNGMPTWLGSAPGSAPASYPAGFVHCDTPTDIVDVINPITGRTWMDRNLGASQVATSSTDATSYGDLYQWGRFADGHQCRNSTTTSIRSSSEVPGHGNFITSGNDWLTTPKNNLWHRFDAINNPCPTGYRLPTRKELIDETKTWSTLNSAGAFASVLKFPLSGVRNPTNGNIESAGTVAMLWVSTISSNISKRIAITTSNVATYDMNRNNGFSVRCIRDY